MTPAEAVDRCLRGATLRAELYDVELQVHLRTCPSLACCHYIHREHAAVMRWLVGMRHSRRLPGWPGPHSHGRQT